MEPSKANTVGRVKILLPCEQLVTPCKFFRACSGLYTKPSITTSVTLSKDQRRKDTKPTR